MNLRLRQVELEDNYNVFGSLLKYEGSSFKSRMDKQKQNEKNSLTSSHNDWFEGYSFSSYSLSITEGGHCSISLSEDNQPRVLIIWTQRGANWAIRHALSTVASGTESSFVDSSSDARYLSPPCRPFVLLSTTIKMNKSCCTDACESEKTVKIVQVFLSDWLKATYGQVITGVLVHLASSAGLH
jgi:hypothetical protein